METVIMVLRILVLLQQIKQGETSEEIVKIMADPKAKEAISLATKLEPDFMKNLLNGLSLGLFGSD